MTTLTRALCLASIHIADADFIGSAEQCLVDARWLAAKGDKVAALSRAADSLRYSVGVFHADYNEVAKAHNAALLAS